MLTVAAFAAAGAMSPHLGVAWWSGLGVGVALLVVEHRIVRPGDYARMPMVFFRLNAIFVNLLLAAGALDLFVIG